MVTFILGNYFEAREGRSKHMDVCDTNEAPLVTAHRGGASKLVTLSGSQMGLGRTSPIRVVTLGDTE